MSEIARTRDAMLLAGNGALTVGADLEQATLRMELVEHYATIVMLARARGFVRELPKEWVEKLLEVRKKAFGRA